MKDKLIEIKDKLIELKNKTLNGPKWIKLVVLVVVALVVIFIAIKLVSAIYIKVNSKSLECTYESAVSDYSKLKIEETITNVFVKEKRSKIIQKSTYTVLNKDEDTLESMKKDKEMYVSTFDDIKGASAKYKRRGYKITTTVTYNLKKMEEQKRTDLSLDMNETYDDIKAYYEGYGYTCK